MRPIGCVWRPNAIFRQRTSVATALFKDTTRHYATIPSVRHPPLQAQGSPRSQPPSRAAARRPTAWSTARRAARQPSGVAECVRLAESVNATADPTRRTSRIRSARAHRNRAHGRGAAALTSPRGLDRDSVSQPASGRDPVPVLHPHRRPVTYRASPSPGRKLALTTRQSTVTVATVAAFRARRVLSLSLW